MEQLEIAALLAPVMALVLWTYVMWGWMYVTRVPAVQRMGMKLDPNIPRGEQMATLPPSVRWKADNYNHLFEQPVLFYATALTLALLRDDSSLSLGLAWAYVGSRVVHSVYQATLNRIEIRFALFALSSLILLVLAVRAALQVF